jgi:hypothetical protein
LDVRFQMGTEIDELCRRIDKIERQKDEEVLSLVEILSNATFFGEIKKSHCEYARDGQCIFFVLDSEQRNKMPIITECRIRECQETYLHCHIELSNISCTLCQRIVTGQERKVSKLASKRSKETSPKTSNFNHEKPKINKVGKQK